MNEMNRRSFLKASAAVSVGAPLVGASMSAAAPPQSKLLKSLQTESVKASKKVVELDVMLEQLEKKLKSARDDAALADINLGTWSKKQRQTSIMMKMANGKLRDAAEKTLSKIS